MIGAMSRVWLLIASAIALGACDPPQEAEARLLCTAVCECTAAPLPSVQNQCVARCVSRGEVENASQACSECIFTHADRCASLASDCEPLCDVPEPVPGGNGAGKGGN